MATCKGFVFDPGVEQQLADAGADKAVQVRWMAGRAIVASSCMKDKPRREGAEASGCEADPPIPGADIGKERPRLRRELPGEEWSFVAAARVPSEPVHKEVWLEGAQRGAGAQDATNVGQQGVAVGDMVKEEVAED